MRIDSSNQARNAHLDEAAPHPETTRAKAPREHAPDWDRVPTLDASAVLSIQSGTSDVEKVKSKVEQLKKDVEAFQEVMKPFTHELDEALEGAHLVEQATEILLAGAFEHPAMLPLVAPVALATASAGGYKMVHGLEGCSREAKETVEKGRPALEKVLHDIEELRTAVKAAATPHASVERSTYVRG